MNKQPQVTEKTKKKIIEAYWSLLKSNEKISVVSVSKKAHINRSTFYEYFAGINELKDSAEDELFNLILNEFFQIFSHDIPKSLDEFYEALIQVFAKVGDMPFYVIAKDVNSHFVQRIKNQIKPMFIRFMSEKSEFPYIDYIFEFSISAIRGVALKWYNDGKTVPINELIIATHRLLATGIFGFVGKSPLKTE